MATPVRPFRGVSAVDRLTQRRADLMSAGLKEVGEVGVTKLRMSSVCQRAGLTQRYFYEHFRNRDELIEALFDAMVEEMVNRTLEVFTMARADLWSRARIGMEIFLDMLNDNPHRARLLAESASIPTLAEKRSQSIRLTSELVVEQAEAILGRAGAQSRARMRTAAYVVIVGHAETSLAWRRGEVPLSRNEYIDLIATTFVSALEAAHGDERPERET